jgi:hypothetical protein
VSIREDSAKSIIEKFGWTPPGKPTLVLDPTLLLPSDDYKLIIDNSHTDRGSGLFCYILDMKFCPSQLPMCEDYKH